MITPLSISPDHKTIFFSVNSTTGGPINVYSCNIDGSNPHIVISNAEIPVAY